MQHEHKAKARGIQHDIKQKIIELHKMGIKAPSQIIASLRLTKRWPPQQIPKPTQISSFLQAHRYELYGDTQICYADIREWYEGKKEIPDDLDDVFVIGQFTDPKQQTFRINCTTRRLLELASKSNIITTDAT